MKYPRLLSLALLAALPACTGPVIMGADAGIIIATKPDAPPPPDLADQIPPHESWCYQTMGEPQCYAHPQRQSAEQLINVDPQNHYPVDLHAYHEALAAKPSAPPANDAPAVLEPISSIPVQPAPLPPATAAH